MPPRHYFRFSIFFALLFSPLFYDISFRHAPFRHTPLPPFLSPLSLMPFHFAAIILMADAYADAMILFFAIILLPPAAAHADAAIFRYAMPPR